MQGLLSISAFNVSAYYHVAAVKKPVIVHAIKHVSAYEPADSAASQIGSECFDLTLVKQPRMEANGEGEEGKGSETGEKLLLSQSKQRLGDQQGLEGSSCLSIVIYHKCEAAFLFFRRKWL